MGDRKADRRGRATLPEAVDLRSLLASADRAEVPVLVVLTGPQVGQRILLESSALVGHDPEADLMLVGDGVEWHHASFSPKDGGWIVRDLTGHRRTEVNGMRVSEILLSDDDQIIIGGTVLRFELHDPVEQAYDEAIQERLTKDDLTGLLSRRTFDVTLESALAAADRHDRALALLVVDIDGVKHINDRLGHLVGAHVIREVGRRIGDLLGEDGCACRLGGDEFGVIVPGVGLAAGEAMGERIRAAVAAARIAHEGERLAVTVSVGVAAFPEHATAPLDLLRRADDAMYVVKRAGGDAVGRYVAPTPA
ncbi:MAG: diguanylate cyclase [Sandaracinaceae bacterium]|nr:diguanylate cyclase [Sandaracinaceae bacterium]